MTIEITQGDEDAELAAWLKERDRVLLSLDIEGGRTLIQRPEASDEAILAALHKARVDVTAYDDAIRLESAQWLHDHGMQATHSRDPFMAAKEQETMTLEIVQGDEDDLWVCFDCGSLEGFKGVEQHTPDCHEFDTACLACGSYNTGNPDDDGYGTIIRALRDEIEKLKKDS